MGSRLLVGSFVLLAVLTVGCADSEPQSSAAPGTQPVLGVDHAALGFVDVYGAIVDPWCSAVLVAPDVVITVARCVENIDAARIRFGVGAVTPDGAEGGMFQVRLVMVNPDHAQWQHDLAALILARPLTNVTPVAMGIDLDAPARLESVAYSYVHRGESGLRTLWSGNAQPSDDSIAVVATEGNPSCQCVTGAGMINEAGQLLGFVSAGAMRDPNDPSASCAASFNLAAVSHNQTFLQQALAASATAVVP
ncbi:MAG TPA: trypsin-like serine protease [Polyangia bacterium]|jgi:hypothetical protein|nr:trypsin-like serine protease [Polyangia bacterium]